MLYSESTGQVWTASVYKKSPQTTTHELLFVSRALTGWSRSTSWFCGRGSMWYCSFLSVDLAEWFALCCACMCTYGVCVLLMCCWRVSVRTVMPQQNRFLCTPVADTSTEENVLSTRKHSTVCYRTDKGRHFWVILQIFFLPCGYLSNPGLSFLFLSTILFPHALSHVHCCF